MLAGHLANRAEVMYKARGVPYRPEKAAICSGFRSRSVVLNKHPLKTESRHDTIYCRVAGSFFRRASAYTRPQSRGEKCAISRGNTVPK